jgi:hypothetical protein
MKSVKRAILFGFLLWLIPFVVSIPIFPLKEAQSPLFETIMAVTLTVCVVFFSLLYFRKMSSGFLLESVKLGIIWFVISIIIDLLMFMWGPMKMSFINYMLDIGFTYLIYPIVTIGFGLVLKKNACKEPPL